MFEPGTLDRVEHKFLTNTTSSFILWNESGAFRWEKLPAEVQLSPIKKSIVKDFNGDGFPDILMGGNDHTYDIGTGYYDANKGLLLLSDENVPLNRLLTPSESGIILQPCPVQPAGVVVYGRGTAAYYRRNEPGQHSRIFPFSEAVIP